MLYTPTSLVDILRRHAKNQPQGLSFRFLTDGEFDEVEITYEALDRRARAIGARLQACTKAGDRVLILLPAGLDFVAAYFGCLYARIIAIPVSPPHPARLEESLAATLRIAADAVPAAALLNASLFEAIEMRHTTRDQFSRMCLLVTDREDEQDWAGQWRRADITASDIAFLQYTSGSTTTPKGVMVSHGNLLHNLSLIEKSMGLTSNTRTVFWLPPFHDMGLIGGILQAVYTGYPATLIPHLMFLQRPFRWLQAITRFKATVNGGPNFAYELCVRKIKPEQREQLDLSAWEVAFTGAEPVHHQTLELFAAYFAPCGFRREAFFPCYGLAEATLMVTGGPRNRLPVTVNLLKSGLEANKVILAPETSTDSRTVVGCGQHTGGQKISLVDPETLHPCLPGQIGEVWVSGPSVASGYWNDPAETAATFGAHIPDTGEGPFLRTGDLGFQQDGELFITGRLKNLIIIDGKNHYPHDIERTAGQSHPALQPGGCAVFSIEASGTERVVVLAEVQYKQLTDTAEVVKAIRSAVAGQHEITVHDIKLTLPGSIPRTTSGKIRHFLCKKNYLSGALKEIVLP